MTAVQRRSNFQTKLQLEVDRMLYVRNLPDKVTQEEMYKVFGRYGPIERIRIEDTGESKGTAFVVYEDIYNAQLAHSHLKGIKMGDSYLTILYHRNKVPQRIDHDRMKTKKQKMGQIRPKLILSDD